MVSKPAVLIAHHKEWRLFRDKHDGKARNFLIVRYLPLARYVASTIPVYDRTKFSYDDFVSWACIGLIDAIEKFNPGRAIKFETYAISRIRGSILDNIRRMTRNHPVLSLEQILENTASVPPAFVRAEGKEENIFAFAEMREQREILAGVIDGLKKDEQRVIMLYYYEGLTMKEIADIMGLTEGRISQIHAGALRNMKAGLTKRGKP